MDEVNLLDDGLVDVVLDSAASAVNTVEREGISITHPARFIMIGSGNPSVRYRAAVPLFADATASASLLLSTSGVCCARLSLDTLLLHTVCCLLGTFFIGHIS